VADYSNGRLRKVSPTGAVSTLATGLNGPVGVGLDSSNNIFVACSGSGNIRELTQTGTLSTYATGFTSPNGLAVDGSNNIYITEFSEDVVMRITTDKIITTLAGSAGQSGSTDGTNNAARFNHPWGVAVDGSGNLFVSDSTNCAIRRLTPSQTNWIVTTIAGQPGRAGHLDGIGTNTLFNAPTGIAVDGSGNVYVSDRLNECVRKLIPYGSNWLVTTAGYIDASVSASAGGWGGPYIGPRGIVVDGLNRIYVSVVENLSVQVGSPEISIYDFQPDLGFNQGQFGFDFAGPPGHTVIIDFSTDLVNWAPILTNTINSNSNYFNDPSSGNIAARFYRLRSP
jgi:hypothetical protein